MAASGAGQNLVSIDYNGIETGACCLFVIAVIYQLHISGLGSGRARGFAG